MGRSGGDLVTGCAGMHRSKGGRNLPPVHLFWVTVVMTNRGDWLCQSFGLSYRGLRRLDFFSSFGQSWLWQRQGRQMAYFSLQSFL